MVARFDQLGARRKPATKGRRRLSLAVGALCVLVLAAGATWLARERLLTWQLHARLNASNDAELFQCLRQTLELGEAGVGLLAAELASPRPAVRKAAFEVLATEIESWRDISREQAIQRSSVFAAGLSAKADRLAPLARVHAAELAARVVRWSIDLPAPERQRLVARCESVMAYDRGAPFAANSDLESDAYASPEEIAVAAAATKLVVAESTLPVDAPETSPKVGDVSLPEVLPGGNLPIEAHPGPTRVPPADVAAAAPEPARLRTEPKPEPLPSTAAAPVAARNTPASSEVKPSSADEPRERPAALGVIELLGQLHAGDARVETAAREQLVARGFSARQIEVGRRLTDPNPTIRREWTEMLPRLADVEAKPWLLWLSRDADAEVRRTALSLMATTGDFEMLARVREMARNDASDNIRQQAARVAAASSDIQRR